MPHLSNHFNHHDLQSDNTLHVIGVVQNTVRFQSRIRLFKEWAAEMCATPNVKLHVVEAVYGDRHPECEPTVLDYNYKAVRINSEIWLKENMINLAVRHLLPKNWNYMAWVDCDVHFRRKDWAMATMHQLQHFNVVQPWTHAIDMDYNGGILKAVTSFGYLVANKKPSHHGNHPGSNFYTYAHPGYAWSCTRYFYENVEKLLDFCIVGAGDHHMAYGCLGKIRETIHNKVGQDYLDSCLEWQRKARRACAGIVGYVHGTIEHHWHGKKSDRKYWGRWDILLDHGFNPKKDICFDSQGVVQLCGENKYKLEHDVMLYNRARNEDSIDGE